MAALTTRWLDYVLSPRPRGDRRCGGLGRRDRARGATHALWLAAALLAVAGAADSVSAVCRQIINQTVTPDAMRGRMSSVFSLVVTSGPRLGDIESGAVASLTSARFSVASGGLACVAGTAVIVAGVPGAGVLRPPHAGGDIGVRPRCPGGRLTRDPGRPPGASPGTTATPSRASADWPREYIARESARCAAIGWSAPSIRHSSRRPSATETGAVLSAISRASAYAAGEQLVRRVDAAHEAAGERLLRRRRRGRSRPTPSPG